MLYFPHVEAKNDIIRALKIESSGSAGTLRSETPKGLSSMLLHGTRRQKSARFHVPVPLREQILEQQENKCIYCGGEFGTFVRRRFQDEPVKLEWDHFIPHSYANVHLSDNIVAACSVCNQIKNDKVFDSLDDAVRHIRKRRAALGFEGEKHHKAVLRGEQQAFSVLTEDDVIAIRNRYAAGGTSFLKLGQEYGVSATAIRRVVLHLTWKHVSDEPEATP